MLVLPSWGAIRREPKSATLRFDPLRTHDAVFDLLEPLQDGEQRAALAAEAAVLVAAVEPVAAAAAQLELDVGEDAQRVPEARGRRHRLRGLLQEGHDDVRRRARL